MGRGVAWGEVFVVVRAARSGLRELPIATVMMPRGVGRASEAKLGPRGVPEKTAARETA